MKQTQVGEEVDADDVGYGISILLHRMDMKAKDSNTLHPNIIYPNGCSSYNSMLNEELLDEIRQLQTLLYGHFNFDVSKTYWAGNYIDIDSWLYRDVIENLFSVPVLKHQG